MRSWCLESVNCISFIANDYLMTLACRLIMLWHHTGLKVKQLWSNRLLIERAFELWWIPHANITIRANFFEEPIIERLSQPPQSLEFPFAYFTTNTVRHQLLLEDADGAEWCTLWLFHVPRNQLWLLTLINVLRFRDIDPARLCALNGMFINNKKSAPREHIISPVLRVVRRA